MAVKSNARHRIIYVLVLAMEVVSQLAATLHRPVKPHLVIIWLFTRFSPGFQSNLTWSSYVVNIPVTGATLTLPYNDQNAGNDLTIIVVIAVCVYTHESGRGNDSSLPYLLSSLPFLSFPFPHFPLIPSFPIPVP